MMSGLEPGMGFGGWFWAIVVIALIVAIGGRVVGTLRDRGSATADPAGLLKERLARGQISPDEYEQASRLLGQ